MTTTTVPQQKAAPAALQPEPKFSAELMKMLSHLVMLR